MKQNDLFEDDSFEIVKPLTREELEIALAVIIKTKSSKITDKLKAIEISCKMNRHFSEKTSEEKEKTVTIIHSPKIKSV